MKVSNMIGIRRRNFIVAAAFCSVSIFLICAGFVYENWHMAPSASEIDPLAGSDVGIVRTQPDAYYDDPWVYFIGDSFVKSDDLDPSTSWPAIVGKQRGWYVRNFGTPGAGYATRGQDGREYSQIVRSADLAEADGIVLAGGFSDSLSPAPLDVIERGINGTFTAVRQASPSAPITVLPMFPPDGADSVRVSEINRILQRVAPDYQALFIPVVDVQPGMNLFDQDMRLSADGNREIARVAGPLIVGPTDG